MRKSRSNRELQSPPEVIADLESAISALMALCHAYDRGARNVSPSMTNEIIKILESNSVTKRIASQKSFSTPEFTENEVNLLAECKLFHPKLQGIGADASLDFVPAFEVDWTVYAELSLRDWWSKDTIYRASSASDPFGGVDADPLSPTPKSERLALNRSELVRAVRNQRGSHIDASLARELKHLEKARSFGLQFAYLQEGVELQPKIVGSPLKAMIREISEQVLSAYGHTVGAWGRYGKGNGVVPHLSMSYNQ